ncbi:MAG: DivIVA domain-containing protein [Bifidobacteriaceae bacterium]|nr:DivIVA domain-containing protein [Bifidobacteriaceae bacterium]
MFGNQDSGNGLSSNQPADGMYAAAQVPLQAAGGAGTPYAGPQGSAASLVTARQVDRQKFGLTRFHAGYDIDQVDDFLEQAKQTLSAYESGAGRSGMLTSAAVENQFFEMVQFREAYKTDQVDDFVKQIAATLRYYEAGGAQGARQSSTMQAASSGYAASVAPAASVAGFGSYGGAGLSGGSVGAAAAVPPLPSSDGAIPVVLRLPADDKQALEALAASRNQSVSQLIHDWVSTWKD